MTLYREAERAFSEGVRVQFTAPNRDQGVANRDLGTIEKIDESRNLRIRVDSDRAIAFKIRENPHLDHGYAVASHSSQGQTADRVLIHVDTEQGERSSLIVAWHTLLCRVGATTHKSIPTTKPLLPKGLAETFHTDLHWSRHAQQDQRSYKGPSRPLL